MTVEPPGAAPPLLPEIPAETDASAEEAQAPPDPDHFKCYKVRLSAGSPFAPVEDLPIADQFGTLTVDLKKPTRLCSPANKDGEDPAAPGHALHLLCYKARRSPGTAGFAQRSDLFIANQFQASSQVDALRLIPPVLEDVFIALSESNHE